MFDNSRLRVRPFLGFMSLIFALASVCAQAELGADQTLIGSVPVIEEPLHKIQYRSDDFIIYTNNIESGEWTEYHRHHNDLLAVLASDASITGQELHSAKKDQNAPAGTVMYFPYAEKEVPYVHRLTAKGDSPFINVGLEFQRASGECTPEGSSWRVPGLEAVATNRRGRTYRLTLPAKSEVSLTGAKGALLLVPLSEANLRAGESNWNTVVGDFRFFEFEQPRELKNLGTKPIALVVFEAC